MTPVNVQTLESPVHPTHMAEIFGCPHTSGHAEYKLMLLIERESKSEWE